MRFNAQAFNQFLGAGGIGQDVEWRQSFICPCVSPTSGQPDPRHALCAGKGRIWEPPVATVTGVASQKVQIEWQKLGYYRDGDTVLSVPENSPLWDAGQFDRIRMLNSTSDFSMVLRHGEPSEKFLFQPLTISRVFWTHPQRPNEIINGGIPTVGADGVPSWAGGVGEPPMGVSYSITGTMNDEYFIFKDLMSDRNQHQGMRLPKRVVARKWDLFGR